MAWASRGDFGSTSPRSLENSAQLRTHTPTIACDCRFVEDCRPERF